MLSVRIIRKLPSKTWIVALYLQNLIHSNFSGSLYGASWLFTSMALVFVVGQSLKKVNDPNSRLIKGSMLDMKNIKKDLRV